MMEAGLIRADGTEDDHEKPVSSVLKRDRKKKGGKE